MKNGGELIVGALESLGVSRVFCVPGESYLPVLDALHDSEIATIVCRQEGGAAMMAEATGKLGNVPGICFVTRGPGATNASAGIHVAAQDSTPMILFVGQIASSRRHREAFQEVDYQQFLGGMAKWVAEIDSAERVLEMVSRAMYVALSGRPGPVVLVLPEDTLTGLAEAKKLAPAFPSETHPGADDINQMIKRLESADNPLVILGGSRWSQAAVDQITNFAERFELPVACSFRRQGLFDHNHRLYAGDVGLGINPQLVARIKSCDCLLLVGGRLSEIPSQDFTLLEIPEPRQPLIHVHPDPLELGKLYRPVQAINASPVAFCEALEKCRPTGNVPWAGRAREARNQYEEWTSLDNTLPGAETLRGVMRFLSESLPDDAVICNGAGNYAGWIHRFWRFSSFGSQVAPTSGSMGYGLPAAIAAKMAHPEKTVLAFAGDGCFQMTCQEFGTAVQHGAHIIAIIIDNGMYGTIRMHQEIHFPGRVSATDLVNPDFAAWARSYGAYGATVSSANEFAKVFEDALTSGAPALIRVMVDPDALTPTLSLAAMNQ